MPAHILIIEDNPDNLELMRYILEMHDYRITPAENGEAGLRAVRELKPDLIICDIQLPGLNGYEIAAALKDEPELNAIPLIAVTAYAMVGDREKILAAGFDSYIAKPILPELFAKQIEIHLPINLRSRQGHAPGPYSGKKDNTTGTEKGRILVVDNLQMNLDLAISLLGNSGYTVDTATGMYDALNQATRQRPDFILSDVGMAEGSGYDLVRIIKADEQLNNIPVMLITSTAISGRARAEGLAAGAARFLFRPIDPEVLLQEIEACLPERKP
ncbi:MAG: response regulator [Gammaproteobacteria bacterium]